MSKASFVAAGILISLLPSCSLFLPRESGVAAGIEFSITEKKRFTYEGRIVGPVRRQGSRLYWVTDKKKLYGFDVQNENFAWTYGEEAGFDVPPVIGQGSLFVLDREEYLHAVDGSGQLLWKIRLDSVTPLNLSLALDLLVIGTEEGRILALDPSSGRQLWHFQAQSSFPAATISWENSLVCSSLEGQIYVLSPRGRVLKTLTAGGPIQVAPLVDDGRLYAGAEDGYFYCFDLRRGKRKWRVDVRGKILAPARADGKRIFFSSSNCILYCLNKKKGDILWWQALPSRSPYELEFTDGQILVSSLSPTVLWLDRRTGEKVGAYEASSEIKSNPIWQDDLILIHLYNPEEEKGSLVFLQGREKAKASLARGDQEQDLKDRS